jgi:hypothetical protein
MISADLNDREHGKFAEVDGKVAVRVANPDGTSVSEKKFYYRETLTESTDEYFLYQAADGDWQVYKKGATTMAYASVKNNPTVTTYDSAKTNYLTLTYGTPPEAI